MTVVGGFLQRHFRAVSGPPFTAERAAAAPSVPRGRSLYYQATWGSGSHEMATTLALIAGVVYTALIAGAMIGTQRPRAPQARANTSTFGTYQATRG
jgi:hypothetical protein